MKKILLIVLALLIMTGCENKVENEKNDYLIEKEALSEQKEFSSLEELPCDVTISVDRTSSEEISYRAILDNPKEDMTNVKSLVIHNNFTEDIFPSIGIFDSGENLLVGATDVKGIELVGYIETTKEISDLNLEIKIRIQYTNSSGERKEYYYKTTK